MSIDMKSYAVENEPPADVEQSVAYNSYQSNEHEYPTPLPPEEKQEEPQKIAEVQASQPKEDPQAYNFKALSESVERLKAEREAEKKEYQLQLDMLRANLSSKQQVQEAPQQKRMFEGMEESDIPNVGELRKAWGERESAYNERIEELQVQNQFPDYAEVITKHGKHLAETDPVFLQGLRGASNKAMFAYKYAKREQEFQEMKSKLNNPSPQAPQKSMDAQRIVDNARKPGTLAQAGGQSVLGKADYYETMSDQDFMKFAAKHLESI